MESKNLPQTEESTGLTAAEMPNFRHRPGRSQPPRERGPGVVSDGIKLNYVRALLVPNHWTIRLSPA